MKIGAGGILTVHATPRRRLSLGPMRGLNRTRSHFRIPASPPRRPAPVMTGEAPPARAAAVSPCSRTQSAALGADWPAPGFFRPHPRERRGHGAGDLPERVE